MQNSQRLDIRRCSDEAVKRLVSAILMQAVRDWDVSVKNINKKGRDEKDIYELKLIINFIQSDYFVSLTNANCPQRDTVDCLLRKIIDRSIREELFNYSLVNEQKWVVNRINKRDRILIK